MRSLYFLRRWQRLHGGDGPDNQNTTESRCAVRCGVDRGLRPQGGCRGHPPHWSHQYGVSGGGWATTVTPVWCDRGATPVVSPRGWTA